MIKHIILLLLIITFLWECSVLLGKGHSTAKNQENEEQIQKALSEAREQEIDIMKEDRSFYWGVGTADIVTTYTEARQQAKENALRDLSGRIRTEVTSELIRTISNVATLDAREYSERERQVIEERSRFYTDTILSNIHWDKFYDDHPRKGVITCIVRKSVQEYEEQVTNELNNNKQMISGFIRTGDNDFRSGRHLSAFNNWALAKEMIQNIFGGLPIFHDIDEDGFDEELNSYLNDQVTGFFTNIRFSLADESKILYDARGNLKTRPVIMANYIDNRGIQVPISSLPLQVSVIEGIISLPGQIETGSYGQYELNMTNLDASYITSVLRVSTDTERIPGLHRFSLPVLPSMTIRMERIKTIALSLTFINRRNISTPGSLLQSLKRTIISQGFSVIEVSVQTDNLTASDIANINRTNADFFLNVYLDVADVQTVGGYQNAFNARCSGSINLYRLPGIDNIIASEPLHSEQGFGSSAENAGLNAYVNLVPIVERHIEKIISDL